MASGKIMGGRGDFAGRAFHCSSGCGFESDGSHDTTVHQWSCEKYKCRFKDLGCKFVGTFSRRYDHICEFSSCHNTSCDVRGDVKMVATHLPNCEWSLIQCTDCAQSYPQRIFIDHKKRCLTEMVVCDLCDEKMSRGALIKEHDDMCRKEKVLELQLWKKFFGKEFVDKEIAKIAKESYAGSSDNIVVIAACLNKLHTKMIQTLDLASKFERYLPLLEKLAETT
ncbi:MAG: hypothetical protein Hyperionvirus1_60 [Hyperionvirus sp.]|uniref:TRAF-type domain-containing protein n=1 Tax=Hyperionvirus sp. TaxID=2487770 RepID=A0A3G5A8I6_9VIRU|nr:MAG: hypothetical protein Hyperionvirus1_60 [Hyperionvirus sp.]